MDRSNRRRRLGVVAVVVGALASAGTSPSPTATPALSTSQQGTLTVTAEEPVAWVDISANEDADLVAAEGQTTVRLDATALDLGVFLIADELGAPDNRYTGLGSVNRSAACPIGAPCAATIRLTAILVDPVGHPTVDVQYTGTAETRFPSSSGPVPSAAVDVVVSDVTSMAAAAAGLSTTNAEEIRLGPDVPRAVRTVHVSLPGGLPADATLWPNVAVLTTLLGEEEPGYSPDFIVRSVTRDGPFDVPAYAPLLSPFADCEVDVPCEADVELQFDWNGGPAEDTALEWSLAAWPGLSERAASEASTIDQPVPADVTWDGPTLTSSMTGHADLTRNAPMHLFVTPALNLSDVPQRVGDVAGLIRLTFRATLAPGGDPNAIVRLSISGHDIELPGPGQTLTGYSGVSEISCGGRSVCQADMGLSVGLSRDSADGPPVAVDWTADVEFLPVGDTELPDDAQLDLVLPSPRP